MDDIGPATKGPFLSLHILRVGLNRLKSRAGMEQLSCFKYLAYLARKPKTNVLDDVADDKRGIFVGLL